MDEPLVLISYIALWVLVLFQTLVLLELVAQGRGSPTPTVVPPAALEDMLPTGSHAPSFALALAGSTESISSETLTGTPTLLAFVSPTCTTCDAVADELAGYRRASRASLVVICSGPSEACAVFATSRFPAARTLIDERGEVAKSFKIPTFPTAVLVDENWRILKYGQSRIGPRLGLSDLDVATNGQAHGGPVTSPSVD
jgi:peroxiredoxin